ncbi:GltK2 [Desulforapulum autotrophicum HRM2]|uniref:Glutamate/aspartate import permease protein GltK n=1 Tax=Desulforapulum autotrophicum (strain ATCC 43914 / DSM 3382 / VKM B-1955 / HRM2) TaxID=177437 RepID=C0QE02_DESAH|nr:amino acid ABC transporter permease [Desulforapulum autotrophicum]ACN17423.1 GltK2 [Desulforapulum autotrophicum HRM2]
MDVSVIYDNLGYMAGGLWLTFEIAVMAITGGLVWGILLGLGRLSSIRLVYYPASIYIHFFRGIPLILVIFWIYFLVPVFLGRSLGELPAVVLSFILYEAAYFAEIIRAGIQAVPVGQKRAGLATGLRPWDLTVHVILPQALSKMVPALITHCVVVFQDTSLAYVIGLREFLRRVNLVDAREARSVELYLFAACVYFIICTLGSFLGHYLEHRSKAKEASYD